MPNIRNLQTGATKGTTPPKTAPKPAPKPAAPAAKPVPAAKPAPAPKPTPVPARVVKEPVAAPNVRALQKAAGEVQMPAFLQRLSLPEVIPYEQSGYIGFADTQSKNWASMQAAGIEAGQAFLYKDKTYTLLDPFEYVLLMGEAFRTTMEGKEGKFTFVTRDTETPLREFAAANPKALKAEPHYCCLCLVHVGGALVPVKGDFRGTKSGAAESAILAVQSAESPEWLRISDAHKVTSAFPQPFGRVWNTVTTQYKVSKSSGNPYFQGKCQPTPSTIDQMQLIVDSFANPEFVASLEEAERNYQSRIEFLDKIASGETEAEQQPAAQ